MEIKYDILTNMHTNCMLEKIIRDVFAINVPIDFIVRTIYNLQDKIEQLTMLISEK